MAASEGDSALQSLSADPLGFKYPLNSFVTHLSCIGKRRPPKFFVLRHLLERDNGGVTRNYQVRYCGTDGVGHAFDMGRKNFLVLSEEEIQILPMVKERNSDLERRDPSSEDDEPDLYDDESDDFEETELEPSREHFLKSSG